MPDIDPLQSLWESCHRNQRLPRFHKKELRYFSDAERFRWWFRYGYKTELTAKLLAVPGTKFQQIRDLIDAEMGKHPEQVHL